MLEVQKSENLDAVRADIAASFQKAAIDTLIGRALQAAEATHASQMVVAGGVGANRMLRSNLAEKFSGEVFFPRPEYCTDNGAMIAFAGAMRLADGADASAIGARARWSLEKLSVPGQSQEQHS